MGDVTESLSSYAYRVYAATKIFNFDERVFKGVTGCKVIKDYMTKRSICEVCKVK